MLKNWENDQHVSPRFRIYTWPVILTLFARKPPDSYRCGPAAIWLRDFPQNFEGQQVSASMFGQLCEI